jgi:hypothetical protein
MKHEEDLMRHVRILAELEKDGYSDPQMVEDRHRGAVLPAGARR